MAMCQFQMWGALFSHVYIRTYLCLLSGVVWHTGKVLASNAVGLRFNFRQDQGIL